MSATPIESKLKRQGGTILPFGAITYHFLPYTDGAHVCEIANEEHIDRLLSIPEGYRVYRGTGQPVAQVAGAASAPAVDPAPAPAAAPEILLGGDFPATFTIHGVDYQLGTIVARACKNSGLNAEVWNAQPQEVRDDLIDAELNAIDEAGQAETKAAAAAVDERAALVAEYVALFGKKPHYSATTQKLRDMIDAERENVAKHAAAAA